ncbi:hypothetical protein RhiJN_24105 [Ceratobasidium sp. AG-Ba]|nr:hypothetical protein RhiJN_24105 [Ceratobasidium sp. AG-Ba]
MSKHTLQRAFRGRSATSSLRRSATPLLRHSTAPLLRCSVAPLLNHSRTQPLPNSTASIETSLVVHRTCSSCARPYAGHLRSVTLRSKASYSHGRRDPAAVYPPTYCSYRSSRSTSVQGTCGHTHIAPPGRQSTDLSNPRPQPITARPQRTEYSLELGGSPGLPKPQHTARATPAPPIIQHLQPHTPARAPDRARFLLRLRAQ